MIILLLMSVLFSAAETAFTSLTPIQLQTFKESSKRSHKNVAKLTLKPDILLGAILVGNNMGNTFSGALATYIAITTWGSSSVPLITVLLTICILVFAEVTPKQLALTHNETIAVVLTPFLRVVIVPLIPLVHLISFFGKFINSIFGGKEKRAFSLDSLLHMVRMAEQEGDVVAYERSAVHGVFRLSDSTALSIITHRRDVFSLPASTPIKKALPIILEHGYSRIPVYGEKGAEQIIGVVLQLDLVRALLTKEDGVLSDLMHPPITVPSSVHLRALMELFNREPLNIAIVLDEYGGLAGVVSREDVVEEILGDLYDENETPEVQIENIENGLRMQGDTPIYKLEEVTKSHIEHDKHVFTVAGYISERLDRIAEEQDTLTLPIGTFIIEKVENNRIVWLLFYPTSSTENVEVELSSHN
jgi:putative hemolysin